MQVRPRARLWQTKTNHKQFKSFRTFYRTTDLRDREITKEAQRELRNLKPLIWWLKNNIGFITLSQKQKSLSRNEAPTE
jgi:hypothetical protein